jgi:hypothetical protein
VRFRWHSHSKSSTDPWKAQDEAQRIRMQWSRGWVDRAVMVSFDRSKRILLPALTRGRWPEPFDA